MWTNRLFEQMDRLFGPIGLDSPQSFPKVAAYPPLNVWEDDDNLYVEAELPGLNPDNIDVAVTEGDQLTIAGERTPRGPEGSTWLRQECGYGRFTRTITLPAAVDADEVEATYEAGVLTLTLPKMEEAKPKRIAVKAVGPAALPAAK
jgi:HSP20 family protein